MAVFTAIAAAVTSFLATSVAFFGCTVLGSAIATATGWIVAGGVASAVAKATGIFKPQGIQQSKDPGVKIQISPATDNRVPVFYGTINTGAIICDAGISNQNDTMVYVMVISEKTDTGTYSVGPIRRGDATLNFGFNSANVISMTDPNATSTTNVANKMRCRVYAGGTAASDQIFPAGGTQVAATTLLPTITASTNYDDLVYAVFEMDYDPENSLTSLGAITFEITNSLKEPSNVLLDYCTNSRYGAGLTSAELDLPSFNALYDYSTEQVAYTTNLGAPDTHDRWQIDGMVSTYQDVKSNIDRLCTSCSAFFAYNPQLGQFSVVPNRAATTAEKNAAFVFNDDVVIGQIDISSTELYSLYNSIEAEYPSVAVKDQTNVVIVSTPASDKNPNEPDNPLQTRYDLVNDAPRVNNLADIDLRQSRISTVVSFEATYEAMGVDVGDVVKLTNAIYGWTNKLFRVMRTTEIEQPGGMLITKFILMEYSDSVYAHNTVQSDGGIGLSLIPGWIPGIWGNIDYGNIANIAGNIVIVDDPVGGGNANVVDPGNGTVIGNIDYANIDFSGIGGFGGFTGTEPFINLPITIPNIPGITHIDACVNPIGSSVSSNVANSNSGNRTPIRPGLRNGRGRGAFDPGEIVNVALPMPVLPPQDISAPTGPLLPDILANIDFSMFGGFGQSTIKATVPNITLTPKGSLGRGHLGDVQAGLQIEDDVANINSASSALVQDSDFAPVITAGSFLYGITYIIISAGTTDFTLIGAADSNPGTTFTATGVGSGTGTASVTTYWNLGQAVTLISPVDVVDTGGIDEGIYSSVNALVPYGVFNAGSRIGFQPIRNINYDQVNIAADGTFTKTGTTITDEARGSGIITTTPNPIPSLTDNFEFEVSRIRGSNAAASIGLPAANATLAYIPANIKVINYANTNLTEDTGNPSPADDTYRGFDVTNSDKRISKSDAYRIPRYGGCFIAGSMVLMADGVWKEIEFVIIGEKVMGLNGVTNTVTKLHHHPVAQQVICTIDNSISLTDTHPMLTVEGWKSFKPELTAEMHPDLELAGKLMIGDTLITHTGPDGLYDYNKKVQDIPVYNLDVDGDDTFIVDGYVVHNK